MGDPEEGSESGILTKFTSVCGFKELFGAQLARNLATCRLKNPNFEICEEGMGNQGIEMFFPQAPQGKRRIAGARCRGRVI